LTTITIVRNAAIFLLRVGSACQTERARETSKLPVAIILIWVWVVVQVQSSCFTDAEEFTALHLTLATNTKKIQTKQKQNPITMIFFLSLLIASTSAIKCFQYNTARNETHTSVDCDTVGGTPLPSKCASFDFTCTADDTACKLDQVGKDYRNYVCQTEEFCMALVPGNPFYKNGACCGTDNCNTPPTTTTSGAAALTSGTVAGTSVAGTAGEVVCKDKSCADCVKAADACSWCDTGRATAEKAGSNATWTSTGSCTQGTKCTAEKAGLDVKFNTCKDGNNAAATVLSLAAVAASAVLFF
jgi:hypothetical protein